MLEEVKNEEWIDEYRSLMFHPKNVLLALLLISLTIIFLALSASFVYTRIVSQLPPVQLPAIFVVNTLVLVAGSLTMYGAKLAYLRDNTRQYQWALVITLALTLLFLGLQFMGWQQLFSNNQRMDTNNSFGYLYVISGLHFAHVIGGIPFLIVFIVNAYKRMKEPVSVLVYFTDPAKRLSLRLLSIYWHFLDALWIYLVLFFWANYLIQN